MHGGKSFLRRDDFSLHVDLNTSDAYTPEKILNNTHAAHLNVSIYPETFPQLYIFIETR